MGGLIFVSNILTQYQGDLTWESHDFGRTIYNKYIYLNSGGNYVINKLLNGKNEYFGIYSTLEEARKVRDLLVSNDWDKECIKDILDEQNKVKGYYKHIQRNHNRYYRINDYKGQYSGMVNTIEEALYYRDIIHKEKLTNVRPKDFDLITDNPYLKYGLEVPIPERLIIDRPVTSYGTGRIEVKGPQSYHVYRSSTYFYACPTFEMAYYVKQELNKCNWDKSKLEEIVDNYPVWYTWLMNFWQYVAPRDRGNGWNVVITPSCNPEGKLEKLYFRSVEDALWERDLLLKYGFNEELLVECADDSQNPYYSMELPPYPQRKIRRIKERPSRKELFNTLRGLILEDDYSQEKIAELAGTNAVTLRNIFNKEFDTNWAEFKTLCQSGEDPNEVLEQKPIIYNPDTSVHIEQYSQYKGNISYYPGRKSPYAIYHAEEYYGSYPSRELAKKIVKDLKLCDWDKGQLKSIQAKYGHQSLVNSKRWVYAQKYTKKDGTVTINGYSVRHKDKTRKMINFGFYKDKRVAELVRDLLIENDWDKGQLESIKSFAYYCIDQVDKYEGYKSY